MQSIPGVISGGAILTSPAALPGATRIASIDSAGAIAATIASSDFDTAGTAAVAIVTHVAASDPHSDRAFATSAISTHAAVTSGVHGISGFGATLVDDADASAARTTLGLGTLATQSGTFSGASSGTNTGDQNLFSTIAVSGQSNVVADATGDTLTLVAGSNITITTNATTDTITISASGGGGGLSDGDYGDITVSGSSTVLTIDANVVTYAKMQDISATSRILGRKTAAAGDTEECTLSEILDFIGSATLGDVLYRGASAWERLPAGSTAGAALCVDPNATNKVSYQYSQSVVHANRGTSGAIAATYDRTAMTMLSTTVFQSSGRLGLQLIWLPKGVTVTGIRLWSGTTALSVGSNQWFALFDSARNKLAVTGDDTSTAWAASTAKSLNLASPFVTTYAGAYYIGICVVATTVPTLSGITGLPTTLARAAALVAAGTADTGLTNPASCPTTAAALTVVGSSLYAEVY